MRRGRASGAEEFRAGGHVGHEAHAVDGEAGGASEVHQAVGIFLAEARGAAAGHGHEPEFAAGELEGRADERTQAGSAGEFGTVVEFEPFEVIEDFAVGGDAARVGLDVAVAEVDGEVGGGHHAGGEAEHGARARVEVHCADDDVVGIEERLHALGDDGAGFAGFAGGDDGGEDVGGGGEHAALAFQVREQAGAFDDEGERADGVFEFGHAFRRAGAAIPGDADEPRRLARYLQRDEDELADAAAVQELFGAALAEARST